MADRPTLNWLLEPEHDELHQVSRAVQSFSGAFGSVIDCAEAGSSHVISLPETAFVITWDERGGENALSPTTFVGAGEVTPEHGRYAILFLATLQKQIQAHRPKDSPRTLLFCTQTGEVIELDNLDQFNAECRRLGLDPSGIRVDAERVGFVEKIYDFREFSPTEPSLYF